MVFWWWRCLWGSVCCCCCLLFLMMHLNHYIPMSCAAVGLSMIYVDRQLIREKRLLTNNSSLAWNHQYTLDLRKYSFIKLRHYFATDAGVCCGCCCWFVFCQSLTMYVALVWTAVLDGTSLFIYLLGTSLFIYWVRVFVCMPLPICTCC